MLIKKKIITLMNKMRLSVFKSVKKINPSAFYFIAGTLLLITIYKYKRTCLKYLKYQQ